MTFLFVRRTVRILILVFDDLAFGVAAGEELGECDSWGIGLDFGSALLLLRLPLLLFLGG